MKKITIIIIGIIIIISGCAQRETLIDLTGEDVKNAEAIKAMAENLLKTWPIYSGILVGALGDRMKDLPQRAIVAIATLDSLAIQGDWTDYELGLSLGLRVHIAAATVTEAIRLYAPDLLDVLPMLL